MSASSLFINSDVAVTCPMGDHHHEVTIMSLCVDSGVHGLRFYLLVISSETQLVQCFAFSLPVFKLFFLNDQLGFFLVLGRNPNVSFFLAHVDKW